MDTMGSTYAPMMMLLLLMSRVSTIRNNNIPLIYLILAQVQLNDQLMAKEKSLTIMANDYIQKVID